MSGSSVFATDTPSFRFLLAHYQELQWPSVTFQAALPHWSNVGKRANNEWLVIKHTQECWNREGSKVQRCILTVNRRGSHSVLLLLWKREVPEVEQTSYKHDLSCVVMMPNPGEVKMRCWGNWNYSSLNVFRHQNHSSPSVLTEFSPNPSFMRLIHYNEGALNENTWFKIAWFH